MVSFSFPTDDTESGARVSVVSGSVPVQAEVSPDGHPASQALGRGTTVTVVCTLPRAHCKSRRKPCFHASWATSSLPAPGPSFHLPWLQRSGEQCFALLAHGRGFQPGCSDVAAEVAPRSQRRSSLPTLFASPSPLTALAARLHGFCLPQDVRFPVAAWAVTRETLHHWNWRCRAPVQTRRNSEAVNVDRFKFSVHSFCSHSWLVPRRQNSTSARG